MKLLVTGSDGMVGYALRQFAPNSTIFISRKDADLTDQKQTNEIFEKYKPTHVLHLAAQVGGMGANMTHPGTFFRNNILINTNVLEACKNVGTKKVLSFLSTCIFPDNAVFPLTEDQLHAGPPHDSNFGYAYAKRMLEVQSRAYKKEFGLETLNVVGTNIYGPNDNFNLQNSHVLAALIHKCFLAKQKNEDLTIWGSGKPLREFVLSDDIAKIILHLIENYDGDGIINLSSGIENSITEVANIIADELGFSGNLIFDSTKSDGQYRKPSDNSKLKLIMSDFNFTTVNEGISKTINWFTNNYPKIRK